MKSQKKITVLASDDPQANLSDYLGYDFDTSRRTLLHILKGEAEPLECIVRNADEHIDYIPADIMLSGAEMFLADTAAYENGHSISEQVFLPFSEEAKQMEMLLFPTVLRAEQSSDCEQPEPV